MKTIELHGILAKKFGRFFKLDVQSAKEACHALACQLPAFRQFMADSEQLGFRFAVFNGKKRNAHTNISEQQLDNTTCANHIHIVPRVIGSGGKTAGGQRIDSLAADYNGNKSSVANQLKTLSDKDKAQAQKLFQLEASLGQKASATTLNQTNTKVSQVEGRINAEAQKTTTLQTTVNAHTASITQQAQSINGLNAQWAVKAESNGVISGIGSASSNGKSRFAIRADVVDIVALDGTRRPGKLLFDSNYNPMKIGTKGNINNGKHLIYPQTFALAQWFENNLIYWREALEVHLSVALLFVYDKQSNKAKEMYEVVRKEMPNRYDELWFSQISTLKWYRQNVQPTLIGYR